MTDLNKWIVEGRLTKDCGSDPQGRDFGYIGNGTCKAVVSIAVNRSKKQQDGTWGDEVSYFDINIWGKTAENLKPYLVKGQQIVAECILKQERWEDKQTGKNMSKIAIHAENVWLCGGKREGQQNNAPHFSQPQSQFAQQYQQQQNGYQTAPQHQQPQNNGGFQEDLPYDENIPF